MGLQKWDVLNFYLDVLFKNTYAPAQQNVDTQALKLLTIEEGGGTKGRLCQLTA